MANVRAVNPGRFCVYCQKEFKNQIAAEQHMVTKHGRIEPRVIQSADDAVVTDTTITHCALCNQSFQSNHALRQHFNSKHPALEPENHAVRKYASATSIASTPATFDSFADDSIAVAVPLPPAGFSHSDPGALKQSYTDSGRYTHVASFDPSAMDDDDLFAGRTPPRVIQNDEESFPTLGAAAAPKPKAAAPAPSWRPAARPTPQPMQPVQPVQPAQAPVQASVPTYMQTPVQHMRPVAERPQRPLASQAPPQNPGWTTARPTQPPTMGQTARPVRPSAPPQQLQQPPQPRPRPFRLQDEVLMPTAGGDWARVRVLGVSAQGRLMVEDAQGVRSVVEGDAVRHAA